MYVYENEAGEKFDCTNELCDVWGVSEIGMNRYWINVEDVSMLICQNSLKVYD